MHYPKLFFLLSIDKIQFVMQPLRLQFLSLEFVNAKMVEFVTVLTRQVPVFVNQISMEITAKIR